MFSLGFDRELFADISKVLCRLLCEKKVIDLIQDNLDRTPSMRKFFQCRILWWLASSTSDSLGGGRALFSTSDSLVWVSSTSDSQGWCHQKQIPWGGCHQHQCCKQQIPYNGFGQNEIPWVWVSLTYPCRHGCHQHQIPKSESHQHQNPRTGCRQHQIPRGDLHQHQISRGGCCQHQWLVLALTALLQWISVPSASSS